MKLAYLILAHKNKDQLVDLIQSLSSSQTIFYIHIDGKSDMNMSELSEQLKPIGNVYLIADRNNITWGGFGITESILKLMRVCLQDTSCDYISIISGQDFPLKSNKEICSYLEKNNGKEYVEYFKLPDHSNWSGNGGLDRFEYYWAIEEMGLKNSGKFVAAQRIEGCKRKFPANLQPFGGSGWFTITSSCASYICRLLHDRPDLLSFFRYTFVPEEILFPTIIMNSAFSANVINSNLRYIDWKSGPNYPKIINIQDLEMMRLSGCFWARKFDMDIDLEIIDEIKRLNAS